MRRCPADWRRIPGRGPNGGSGPQKGITGLFQHRGNSLCRIKRQEHHAPVFTEFLTAFTIAAICSGVLPQHPPTTFAPNSTYFFENIAISSGPMSYTPFSVSISIYI